jgi:AcrR family transcriptional regulator
MTSAELSPRAQEIVSAARELLETDGAEALSMRRIADRLGIRAPSLYKHFRDKEALEAAIISIGFDELADAFEAAAGVDTTDQLAALAQTFRDFASAHPHLYRLMTERPVSHRVAPGVEARAAGLVTQAAADPDRARAIWAFTRGMTSLELNGRFPPDADLDAAWWSGLRALRGPV